MISLLLAASLLSMPASAWVIDLATDGEPIQPIDGRTAVQVQLPSSVLARQDTLRFLGGRGTSIRSLGLQCTVRLPDGKGSLTPAYDRCASVYEIAPGGTVDLLVQPPPPAPATVLRLVVPPALDRGAVSVEADGRLTLPQAPDEAELASFFLEGRWWPAAVEVDSERLVVDGAAQAALDRWLDSRTELLLVRAEQRDGTELEWRLDPASLPSELPRAEAVALPQAPATAAALDVGWCQPEAAPGQAGPVFLYCLDAASGAVQTRRFLSSGVQVEEDSRTLPTGSFIEVAVRHTAGVPVSIELSDGAVLSRGEEILGLLPTPDGAARQTTRRRFAPRDPGPLTLSASGPAGVLDREELLVVTRYAGALRLGLGLALPATGVYELGSVGEELETAPVEGGVEPVEGELVVGFSPFLDVGGRDYLDSAPYRVAPYLGLGLLASSGANLRVSLLQSLYAGMDLELTPAFAVDFAFTLRRLERLESGWEVGDYIDKDEDVPTRQVFRPGVALVFSVTPDALRFQARAR